VADRSRHSLPDLGRRGEGWFGVQVVLLATVAIAGGLGPDWSGPARTAGVVLGAILIGLGGLLAVRGVVDLRENLSVFPRPPASARLVDSGAYRLVRHPIYAGLILGTLGWSLVTASVPAMAGAAALALFLDLKSRREELWLSQQFDGYDAYRARTRRFVPWLY
jgi:protein-S-isoprenylcysteine O-methyltransferase Ste14